MESINPECTKLKQKYEACFYNWYSEKYLAGKSKEDECAPLFKEYRACLEVTERLGCEEPWLLNAKMVSVWLSSFLELFEGKEH